MLSARPNGPAGRGVPGSRRGGCCWLSRGRPTCCAGIRSCAARTRSCIRVARRTAPGSATRLAAHRPIIEPWRRAARLAGLPLITLGATECRAGGEARGRGHRAAAALVVDGVLPGRKPPPRCRCAGTAGSLRPATPGSGVRARSCQLSLEEMAGAASMSKGHLCRLFAATRLGPGQGVRAAAAGATAAPAADPQQSHGGAGVAGVRGTPTRTTFPRNSACVRPPAVALPRYRRPAADPPGACRHCRAGSGPTR